MMKRFLFFMFLFFVICSQAQAIVDTFYVETSDVYMRSSDANYTTAHDMQKPNNYYSSTVTVSRIGQIGGGTRYVERTFWAIVTSALTSSATINSATFHMSVTDDWSTTDFDISIMKGLWSSDPPDSAEFEFGVGWDTSAVGGALNTNGLGTGWKTITLDSLNWINKTGTTRFCIVSSRDLSRTISGGDEHIQIKSANEELYKPYLVITYTMPGVINPPESLRTDNIENNGLVMDTLPAFKAIYMDSSYQLDKIMWRVGTTSGDNDMWQDTFDVSNIDSGNWIDAVDYDGDPLSRNTWYFLSCRSINTHSDTSAWTSGDSFRVASADEVVFVLIVSDTESGDAPINEDSLHPTIKFDTWHAGGHASDVMQKSWRLERADIWGGLPSWIWHNVVAEPYCSSRGDWVDHWEALTAVRDTIYNIWASSVWADSGYNDELALHYHWYDWCSSKWRWAGPGGCELSVDSLDTLELKRYMAALLYNSNDATILKSHRGGWNREHMPLHEFLNSWIFFDPTNVDESHDSWINAPEGDTMWRPYHPSDTNWQYDTPVHEKRIIFGAMAMSYIGATEIDNAWDLATGGDTAILIAYHHPAENMKTQFEQFYTKIKAKEDSTGIPLRWTNLSQAARWYYGWTDSVAPTFNFVQNGSVMKIEVSEPIFNPEPFAVIKDQTANPDTFIFIQLTAINDTAWWYDVGLYGDKYFAKAKFAAVDTCGNAAMDSTEPIGNYQIVDIYRKGSIQGIIISDSLMRIYGNNKP